MIATNDGWTKGYGETVGEEGMKETRGGKVAGRAKQGRIPGTVEEATSRDFRIGVGLKRSAK